MPGSAVKAINRGVEAASGDAVSQLALAASTATSKSRPVSDPVTAMDCETGAPWLAAVSATFEGATCTEGAAVSTTLTRNR